VAVTELAQRWPGEGGIYLWTRNSFGEGHGFFAGWCYWVSNVVYLPTVLLLCVGVGLYAFGASAQSLASSERLTGWVALTLLLGLLVLNVRGQQTGKSYLLVSKPITEEAVNKSVCTPGQAKRASHN